VHGKVVFELKKAHTFLRYASFYFLLLILDRGVHFEDFDQAKKQQALLLLHSSIEPRTAPTP